MILHGAIPNANGAIREKEPDPVLRQRFLNWKMLEFQVVDRRPAEGERTPGSGRRVPERRLEMQLRVDQAR